MTKNKLKEEEVELLNTKLGLRALFANKKINLNRALEKVTYDMHLAGLQTQLIQLQNWVIENNKKVVIFTCYSPLGFLFFCESFVPIKIYSC